MINLSSSFHVFHINIMFSPASSDLLLHDLNKIILFWIAIEFDWAEVVEVTSKDLVLLRESQYSHSFRNTKEDST